MNVGAAASSNCAKNVSYGGKPRFDSGPGRMHAALHDATYPRHQILRRGNADDASGRANHAHHVILAATYPDGIPVRVERSDWNGDAGAQSQLLRPIHAQVPG